MPNGVDKESESSASDKRRGGDDGKKSQHFLVAGKIVAQQLNHFRLLFLHGTLRDAHTLTHLSVLQSLFETKCEHCVQVIGQARDGIVEQVDGLLLDDGSRLPPYLLARANSSGGCSAFATPRRHRCECRCKDSFSADWQ